MFVHTRHLTIQWGDCDPAGIVWYPRYFEMFDASTAQLFAQALAMNLDEMMQHFAMAGMPMVETRSVFHAPTAFGDAVRIESQVVRFRGASFDIEHRLLRAQTVCVEGFETRIWAKRDDREPKRIRVQPVPQAVIDRFDALG